MGVLNACAGLVALEEGRYAREQIIGRGLDSDVFAGNGIQLECMQNVGALRMLGVCSTRCHLEMWSFGMPY
jgi:hypothetical protein